MSRTDKDTPYWVRAARLKHTTPDKTVPGWVACPHYRLGSHRGCEGCGRLLNRADHALSIAIEHGSWPYGHPRRAGVLLTWWQPERAAVRNQLAALRQQHRAGAELDEDSLHVVQARRGMWGGGWYD